MNEILHNINSNTTSTQKLEPCRMDRLSKQRMDEQKGENYIPQLGGGGGGGGDIFTVYKELQTPES